MNTVELLFTAVAFALAYRAYRRLSIQHRLRTPIAALYGLAKILRENDLDEPTARKLVEGIYEQAYQALTALDSAWLE